MKAKSRSRPKRSIFLEAAYRQFLRRDNLYPTGGYFFDAERLERIQYRKYSCENIATVKSEMTNEHIGWWDHDTDTDLKFYHRLYSSEYGNIWWDETDNESRIYALLLTAEMLRR